MKAFVYYHGYCLQAYVVCVCKGDSCGVVYAYVCLAWELCTVGCVCVLCCLCVYTKIIIFIFYRGAPGKAQSTHSSRKRRVCNLRYVPLCLLTVVSPLHLLSSG